MGVYIKGMKMPASCYDCNCFIRDSDGSDYCCLLMIDIENNNKRDDDCPLVPVPKHGQLIDADALMKMCGMATDCYDCPNGEHGWCKRSQDAANICEAIENAPTVITAEEN